MPSYSENKSSNPFRDNFILLSIKISICFFKVFSAITQVMLSISITGIIETTSRMISVFFAIPQLRYLSVKNLITLISPQTVRNRITYLFPGGNLS